MFMAPNLAALSTHLDPRLQTLPPMEARLGIGVCRYFGDLAKQEISPLSAPVSPNTHHSTFPSVVLSLMVLRLRRCPLSGYIFVDFSSEEEVKKALKCNREYMGEEATRPFSGGLGVGAACICLHVFTKWPREAGSGPGTEAITVSETDPNTSPLRAGTG